MSIEADVVTLLGPLVGGRVEWDVADFGTERPYITAQQIGGDVVTFVDPTLPSKRNAMVQINVWADSRLEATALSLQVEEAMRLATAFQAQPLGALVGDYDNDSRIAGARQDFSIWQ